MTYNEIKLAWNAQADKHNQWGELGEDEKVEWAVAYVITKERAAAAKLLEALQSIIDNVDMGQAAILDQLVADARAAISKATDDEAFDDFAEDVEDRECSNCSGTGEGMYDGQSCVVCRGKGFL